ERSALLPIGPRPTASCTARASVPALHNPSGWRAYPGRPSSFRRSSWIVVAIRVAMTSWTCPRSAPRSASHPGMVADIGSVLSLDAGPLAQGSDGASELLEPCPRESDFKIVQREG